MNALAAEVKQADAPSPFVAGERGLPIEAQARRRGARVQTLLAALLIGAVVIAALAWWFTRDATDVPAESARIAERTRQAAASEMRLPPLEYPVVPPAEMPALDGEALDTTNDEYALGEVEAVEDDAGLLGLPPLPGTYEMESGFGAGGSDAYGDPPIVVDPRLATPVLWRPGNPTAPSVEGESSAEPGMAPAGTRKLAERVPGRSRLLARGTLIDCTLETAIDSQLAGLARAVVSRDVWSADGSAVVLERGTRLIGITHSETRAGQSRVWVLWEEARTPSGLVVPLASPATDALGRTGIGGVVDTHFDQRFGAAILLSLIDAGAQALAASLSSGGNSVVVETNSSSEIATEVLRYTINIPPTIRVAQGTRVQALVAQDVNFASVLPIPR